MSSHIDVEVIREMNIPTGMLKAVRDALPDAMRPALIYLRQRSPIVSGTLQRGWRLFRTPKGIAIVNGVPYTRWVHGGRYQRFAYAAVAGFLERATERVLCHVVADWLETPAGQSWAWREFAGVPVPPSGRLYMPDIIIKI